MALGGSGVGSGGGFRGFLWIKKVLVVVLEGSGWHKQVLVLGLMVVTGGYV